MDTLLLEVYTPEKEVLKQEVNMVELQGEKGRLGVLPQHTSLIAKLGFGPLQFSDERGTQRLLCGAGVVEVLDNRVLVLVDTVELPNGIDLDRAEASKSRAEKRLKQTEADIDVERASVSLHRAIQRIEFYSGSKS